MVNVTFDTREMGLLDGRTMVIASTLEEAKKILSKEAERVLDEVGIKTDDYTFFASLERIKKPWSFDIDDEATFKSETEALTWGFIFKITATKLSAKVGGGDLVALD